MKTEKIGKFTDGSEVWKLTSYFIPFISTYFWYKNGHAITGNKLGEVL